MTRARVDAMGPDADSAPMKGTFPTVTQADEVALRDAGYIPVLRWVRVLGSGGLSDKAVTTAQAMRTAARRKPAKRGRR